MTTESDPQGNYVLRPRKQDAGFRLIPNWLKLLLVLSLAALAYIPLASRSRHAASSPASHNVTGLQPAAAGPSTNSLVLGEAQYERESRSVKGFVENSSNATYKDVVVSYTVKDKKGGDLGAISASVPQVAPHSKVAFKTDAMPKEASSYDLRELTGVQVPVVPGGKS